jgi:hypothetical protein
LAFGLGVDVGDVVATGRPALRSLVWIGVAASA